MIKKLYQIILARLICLIFGHWGVINTHEFTGVCSRCGGKYHVSYDMAHGETIWLKRIKTKK